MRGGIAVLDAPVMAASQQFAGAVKKSRANRDTTFGQTQARFLYGDF
jgi:hypothetical protein